MEKNHNENWEKDINWLNNAYPGNNFSDRNDWYKYKIHKQKGATLKQFSPPNKNNVRAKKNTGGSTDYSNKNKYSILCDYERIRYIPPRLDMESLFDFNYSDMLECKPNTKFNIVKSLKFIHKFYNYKQQEQYNRFIDIYNNLTEEELNTINNIYQKLSTYIKENDLTHRYVDGSVICNIALMISHYLQTGEIDTNIDFFNMLNDNDYLDEYNQFHLFLIRNCFISKNRYYHKYINDRPVKNWWAVCHLLHRWSDKDMRSKSLCEGFRNEEGKIIYHIY